MTGPNLRLRPFRGEPDLHLMAPLANESFAGDGLDLFRSSEDFAREIAAQQHFDPERDMVMAEIEGVLAAYARCRWWWQADGTLVLAGACLVPPRWRNRGLGRLLLAWLERRQDEVARAQGAGDRAVREAFMAQGERDRARLVEAAGYQPVRHFLKMVRPDFEAIPDFALPAGVEVRPVRPEHHRLVWDAYKEIMRGHWGYAPPQPGDYELWLQSREFQPQLWQVAWDVGSDRIAGQVKPFIDENYNRGFGKRRGWTEFIAVAPEWRRRGLARALVVRALHAQREAAMQESALGVDSGNAHDASRVYADCGFRTVERSTAWRKAWG